MEASVTVLDIIWTVIFTFVQNYFSHYILDSLELI